MFMVNRLEEVFSGNKNVSMQFNNRSKKIECQIRNKYSNERKVSMCGFAKIL